jgi:outer membrane protein OmpA-like peptidoglycan-associated protein
MKYVLLFISLFTFCSLSAQNSDCNSAVLLTDTVYQQNNAPLGYGKAKELIQPKKYDSTSFKSEKNSKWFILKQSQKAFLNLSIIPIDINDDYDFMIFDASEASFCDSIKIAGKVKPLRSNISRNDKSLSSVTGLNKSNDTSFVGIGVGNSFCKPLLMEADRQYILVICCDRNPQKGFTLKLNYDKVNNNSAQADSLLAKIEAESKKSRNKLQFYFADTDSKQRVEADAVVRTNLIDTGFVISGHSAYNIPFKSQTDLMAVAPGFMIEKRNYMLNDDSLSIVDTIYLKKISLNAYLEIIPFYFEGNTEKLLPKSNPALASLLLFLKKNPNVKIEIQGHANGPKRKNLKEFKRLSENRAEAIKKYLTFQGINKKRLEVEGFGNAMMLFPDPQTEEESELNRRVEIKIIAIE